MAYLTAQSYNVPAVSGHDWNHLVHKLNQFNLDSKLASPFPVMLSAILLSPERHQVVNPLYLVQNPYNAIKRAGEDETLVAGLSFNYGSKSQSSSLDSSPVLKKDSAGERFYWISTYIANTSVRNVAAANSAAVSNIIDTTSHATCFARR